jgi:hypothetical protein
VHLAHSLLQLMFHQHLLYLISLHDPVPNSLACG